VGSSGGNIMGGLLAGGSVTFTDVTVGVELGDSEGNWVGWAASGQKKFGGGVRPPYFCLQKKL